MLRFPCPRVLKTSLFLRLGRISHWSCHLTSDAPRSIWRNLHTTQYLSIAMMRSADPHRGYADGSGYHVAILLRNTARTRLPVGSLIRYTLHPSACTVRYHQPAVFLVLRRLEDNVLLLRSTAFCVALTQYHPRRHVWICLARTFWRSPCIVGRHWLFCHNGLHAFMKFILSFTSDPFIG